METLWYFLIALMLTMYVILDGFDLGAGIAHLFVARTDDERRVVMRSIGPVWDGNEVWLLAAGGSLFLAFPLLYASSFSGFYLPLMIVLWLLILRAISLEFRGHLENAVWKPFWDAVFAGSSILLAVLFGAALGNVVRGVPLDGQGWFFAPLWTTFGLGGPELGILDWYTVLVGVSALAALTHHGALWLVYRTTGPVRERSLWLAALSWWPLAALVVLLTAVTFGVQPHVAARMGGQPLGLVFPLLALAGLAGSLLWRHQGREKAAFLASCAFLAGILLSAAFGLYPNVLPAVNDPANSLTVHNAAAAPYGLRVALIWWIPGMLLVAGYSTFVYRRFSGKVTLEEEGY
jgi:cytochrome d ubiquinol oxidase subunit II